MKFFEKRKCRKCEWFEWDDEIPECTFGINEVEDIDDFYPMHVHEKNKICSVPQIEVRIKFSPLDNGNDLENHLESIHWLCPENIRLALREACKNTRFEVEYSKRFKRKLIKYQKKINKNTRG